MNSKKKIDNSIIIAILYLVTAICYFLERKSVPSIVFLVMALCEIIITIIFNKKK